MKEIKFSLHMKSENGMSLGKKLLIALGICSLLFVLVVVAFLAYLAFTNPGALEGDQEALLQSVGVEQEDIPTAETITPEQEACAVEKLGQERVDEIKAGASINATDIAKARSCF